MTSEQNNYQLNAKQKRGVQVTVLAVVAFITAIITLFIAGLNKPQILSAEDLTNNGAFIFDNPRSFDKVKLIDDQGLPFTLENLQGQWSLVFFGFTFCPDVCPITMAALNRFYKQQQEGDFGSDLQVIMVSVDPARDTPEILNLHVKYFNPEFIGVTGDFLDIHRFATQLNTPFNKVPGGGENYTVEHGANMAIINPNGHYVGFFKGPVNISKLNLIYRSIRASN